MFLTLSFFFLIWLVGSLNWIGRDRMDGLTGLFCWLANLVTWLDDFGVRESTFI